MLTFIIHVPHFAFASELLLINSDTVPRLIRLYSITLVDIRTIKLRVHPLHFEYGVKLAWNRDGRSRTLVYLGHSKCCTKS